MNRRVVIIGACVVVSAFSYAWSEYLNYRYGIDLLVEPISLAEKTSYSWNISPNVTEEYELVVRFYKNTPPPYDYVTEIIKDETYMGVPIEVNWQLSKDGKISTKGGVGNYGSYYAAANPYVEKGIGRLSLNSGDNYLLEVSIPTGNVIFNELSPEVRITQNVGKGDWLFGTQLIAASIIILALAIAALTIIIWVLSYLWKRYAGS